MITVNEKNTKNKIIVVTHPECEYCKSYAKSGNCSDFDLTKTVVLKPKNDTYLEKVMLQTIYKSSNPADFFKKTMLDETISEAIDLNKDVNIQWNKNSEILQKIEEKFGPIEFTPSIFIADENFNPLEKIDIEIDFSKLMAEEITTQSKKYLATLE